MSKAKRKNKRMMSKFLTPQQMGFLDGKIIERLSKLDTPFPAAICVAHFCGDGVMATIADPADNQK